MKRLGTSRSVNIQIENVLKNVNRDLPRLDNGGYEVVNEDSPTRLSNSDVTMKQRYKDRMDSNIMKMFDKNVILAHGFSFQEAVEELPNRNDIDVRILLIPYSRHFDLNAVGEEYCVCKPTGYGCVIVLTIRNPADWSKEWKVFTHEVAHTLGAMHDDEEYMYNNKLIMWPEVEMDANIWSPVAKESINQQDHSCLRVKNEGGGSEKENKNEGGGSKKKIRRDELEYIRRWLRRCYRKYSKRLCRNYARKNYKRILRTM